MGRMVERGAQQGSQQSGNGWVAGPAGRRVWGRFGAAGLFLLAPDAAGAPCVLAQHRATWTDQGNTWGIPGGARDGDETAAEAALRETWEECGIASADVEVLGETVTAGPFPESGWTYTTVLARAGKLLDCVANEESAELRWVPLSGLGELELLPAFRAALPQIQQVLEGLSR